VALATLIAEWTGLALALWLARDAFGSAFRAGLARLGDRLAIRRMFGASRDIMGRTILLQVSFTTFVFLGARFGDVTLAANQVLMQFLEITAFALDGFAFAAEALIGQAIGARSVADTRASARICMQWGLGGAVVLGAVFALAGPAIIDLMTTSPEVREAARGYLPWLVAAPLIGVAAWVYDGIFIGALLTGDMLRAMLVSVAVYVLALGLLVPVLGNHGLWMALMVLNIVRTWTLWRLYPKVPALIPASG
jgi:multidrug resistance protein, MATE family